MGICKVMKLYNFLQNGVVDMADEDKKKEKPLKNRVHLLDELRGFAVFCMIFYHAFYTVGMIFHWEWGIKLLEFFMPAEPYFAGLFIFISGMVSNISKSNIERGVKLAFVAMGVTLVTYFREPEYIITFGVLHLLASCMILYGLTEKYLRVIPMWLGMTLNIILFIVFYHTAQGRFRIPFLISWEFPKEWYTTNFLFMFGFPNKEFVSSDYFPLVSWVFLFFTGGFFGRLIPSKKGQKYKLPQWTTKPHIPFLGFIGRHALLFYIVHQPIIYGICYGVQWAVSLFQHSESPQ